MSGSELDFDELDKAVNSLMGSVDKENVQTSKTLDINTTLAPDETPPYTNLGQAAESIGSEAIDKHEKTVSLNDAAPTPSPARASVSAPKRSGRFMDVVHPSSDMRGSAPQRPMSVSHQGTAIATPVETQPRVDTTAGNLPVSSEPSPTPSTDESEGADEPDDVMVGSEPVAEPLTSPFLADAKVEKRPLGENSNENRENARDESTPDTPADELAPEKDDLMNTDVHELGKEETSKGKSFSKMDAMNEPAQNLSEVTEHVPAEYENTLLAVERVSTDEPDEVPAKEKAVDDEAPAVISIPKQYQEKPNSGDNSSGSIYDTDHYHKPLTKSNKKPSIWKWIVAIILLIIIGAGLGAAAYFFGFV